METPVSFEPAPLKKRMVAVSGLPRSGSTLLCQLLREHPEVYSPGHSSPLCPAISGLRQHLSDNNFLLAQLDLDPELMHQRLISSFRGFIDGWFSETEKHTVVDKNRGWMQHLETLLLLDPNAKVLVCLREPGQILGSIENQHQKTLLLDFPDHTASHTRYARADALFAKEGVIGGPLLGIQHLQDLPAALQQRVYYVVFEDLMSRPQQAMAEIYQWLELPAHSIDLNNLTTTPHESDSYYRFKYRHRQHSNLKKPAHHPLPARIDQEIKNNFAWFYRTFYPGLLS
ncbi:MAG: sulfotransferase [Gammaproteobacteria bacterium HGW-Gammaproteobacteria-14]|nr:MAG: sulfotransferase [Gammaproteobacteria bacterium HGW-Gammaproteobacteria-14]